SLDPNATPTVLVDAETGAMVLHFAELDMYESDPNERALMLRTVERLRDGARYIVAIRNVVDDSAQPVAPSDAFRALRDDLPTDDDRIEGRRAHYEDLFAQLESLGIPRGELQIAWDFTMS